MAFLPIEEDEEAKIAAEGGAPLPVSGAPASGDPTTDAQGAATQSPGFVDTGSYLSANKEAALGTAKTVSAMLGEKAAGLRTGAEELGTKFSGEIESARINPDQNLLSRAEADPTKFVESEEDLSKFRGYWDSRYEGPTSFSGRQDYQDLLSEVQSKSRWAGGTETEEGRTSLIEGLGGNRTRGMTALDQLLIGADPGAREELRAGAEPYGDLESYLDSIRGTAKASAAGAQEGADEFRTGLRGKYTGEGGIVPSFQSDLQSRLAASKQSETDAFAAAKTDLFDKGGITDESAQYFGIQPGSLTDMEAARGRLSDIHGIDQDITGYLTESSPDVNYATPDRIASEEDYARQSALGQLTGTDIRELDPERAEQAGTYEDRLGAFDFEGASGQTFETQRANDESILQNFPVGMSGGDQETVDQLIDVYTRNEAILNNNQKMWLDNQGVGTDPSAPPVEGGEKLRVIDGQQQWWNGETWGEAPTEIIYRDGEGNQTGPVSGSTPYQFNYDTGEYEASGDAIQDDTGVPDIPGVIGAY